MSKAIRIAAGIACLIVAAGFLMEGGIVRQHVLNTPLEWRWIAVGLPLLLTGSYLIHGFRRVH